MKKNAGELMRVKKIIDGDTLDAKDEFFNLLTTDIDSLLKEYFDYGGYPRVSVEKSGGEIKVIISVLANRIKNFNSIPKP